MGLRRAGLQRHRHGGELGQRDVNDGVVDTGEAQDGNPVAGLDRLVVQCGGDGADAVGQLAVGDGVELGQHFGRGAACGVGDELDRALAEGGSVGVAREDGAHDAGQAQLGATRSVADGLVGLGGGELLVSGVQVCDAAVEPVFAGVGRHSGPL